MTKKRRLRLFTAVAMITIISFLFHVSPIRNLGLIPYALTATAVLVVVIAPILWFLAFDRETRGEINSRTSGWFRR